jgi:predicted DNA-binding protein (UPF0251 family)
MQKQIEITSAALEAMPLDECAELSVQLGQAADELRATRKAVRVALDAKIAARDKGTAAAIAVEG